MDGVATCACGDCLVAEGVPLLADSQGRRVLVWQRLRSCQRGNRDGQWWYK